MKNIIWNCKNSVWQGRTGNAQPSIDMCKPAQSPCGVLEPVPLGTWACNKKVKACKLKCDNYPDEAKFEKY